MSYEVSSVSAGMEEVGISEGSTEGSFSGGCCEGNRILERTRSRVLHRREGTTSTSISDPLDGSSRESWENGSGLGEGRGVSLLGSKEAYPITCLLSSVSSVHPLSRAPPLPPSAGSDPHLGQRVPSQSAHNMEYHEYHCNEHYSYNTE